MAEPTKDHSFDGFTFSQLTAALRSHGISAWQVANPKGDGGSVTNPANTTISSASAANSALHTPPASPPPSAVKGATLRSAPPPDAVVVDAPAAAAAAAAAQTPPLAQPAFGVVPAAVQSMPQDSAEALPAAAAAQQPPAHLALPAAAPPAPFSLQQLRYKPPPPPSPRARHVFAIPATASGAAAFACSAHEWVPTPMTFHSSTNTLYIEVLLPVDKIVRYKFKEGEGWFCDEAGGQDDAAGGVSFNVFTATAGTGVGAAATSEAAERLVAALAVERREQQALEERCAAARSKACAAIEAAAKHVCDDLTKVYQLTAAGRVVEGGYARMQYTSDCATLRACIHEGSAKHGVEAPW